MHSTRFRGAGWAVGLACGISMLLAPLDTRAESESDLRAEVEALRERVAELEALSKHDVHSTASVDSAPAEYPTVSFGGQYRINAYTVDNDDGGGRQTAARVRIRQDIDFQFTERFKTHLQFELGHTDSNRTMTDEPFRVRHAVMDYTFDKGPGFQAGIVPLSDHFGDTLFSSDWDYNPVALSMTAPVWNGNLRVFAGSLLEGLETNASDDIVHYQLDYVLPFSDQNQLNIGGTVVTKGIDGKIRVHANYGIGGSVALTDDWLLRGFVAGSNTERQLIAGASSDGIGVAAKLELISQLGLDLLATYASGDPDQTGFLPTMALPDGPTYGYWGYTGLLTVQGPTDTGFDGDAVNVSNNGFGLASVQLRYRRPIIDQLDVYLAGGWYGASDTPGGRDSFVGADFLAMATYHFNSFLALDFGAAYARLGDGVSGYPKSVSSAGDPFNQALGEERNKYAFFTRLQAEF